LLLQEEGQFAAHRMDRSDCDLDFGIPNDVDDMWKLSDDELCHWIAQLEVPPPVDDQQAQKDHHDVEPEARLTRKAQEEQLAKAEAFFKSFSKETNVVLTVEENMPVPAKFKKVKVRSSLWCCLDDGIGDTRKPIWIERGGEKFKAAIARTKKDAVGFFWIKVKVTQKEDRRLIGEVMEQQEILTKRTKIALKRSGIEEADLQTLELAKDAYKKAKTSDEKDVAICLRKLHLCDHFEPGTLVFVVVSLENDQEVFIAHTFDATTHKRIGITIVANAEGQFGYPKPLFSFYPEGNLTFSGEGVLVVLWGTVMLRVEPDFVVDTKTVPSVFKDGWRIGDLLQAPDEHRCALVRTRMLLDTVLEGSFPHSMIERTFNDPEMVKDLAIMALEAGPDDVCFALTSAYNDLVMHYRESSVMNTEIALHALCLGQYASAERLSDELMVDWDLLDDEELAILRDDEKSYDLLDAWGCDRIETVLSY
jgi:hypothetical protein